jgi:LuxR family maltose regulon positive regulatory protein
LEVVSGAEVVSTLHRKASQWFEEHGFPEDSVHHALTARDFVSAIRIINNIEENCLRRGEFSTLLNWLQQIPDDVLRAWPHLYGCYANILITFGKFEAASAALSYLERTVPADSSLHGEVAFYQTFLAFQQRDGTRLVECAKKSLALLPPDSLAMRSRVSYFLGLLNLRRFRLEDAWHFMTEAYEMAKQIGDNYNGAGGAYQLSRILLLRGRLSMAFALAQEALELAGQSPAAAFPRYILAAILYEQNDLEGAALNVQMGVKLNEFSRNAEGQINAYYILVKKCLIQGDAAGVSSEMENADKAALQDSVSPDSQAMIAANHILIAIQQNDLAAALTWGKKLSEFHLEGAPLLIPELQSVPARLLIARGEKQLAQEQLQVLYDQAILAGALGFAIKIRVYQTLVADKPSQALIFLAEALRMGQNEGFIRTFIDEGRLLAPFLRSALSQGVTPEYTSKLLSIIEEEERTRRIRTGGTLSSSSATGILSEREIEVLQLVSEEFSNQRIAETLGVSLGTVKTHLHHIIDKLEVKDRRQAVQRARDLKLHSSELHTIITKTP